MIFKSHIENPQTQYLHACSLSYEKANAETRSKFSFFAEQIPAFSESIKAQNLGFVFVISTCNRTEIYAHTTNIDAVISTFCEYVNGSEEEYRKYIQVFQKEDALNHLFRVSSGLESQILGDFEIVGQLKIWMKKFVKHELTNQYLEKAVDTAIQISKKIKNQTKFSNGSASVSYTAANCILNHSNSIKNIVLLGTGKIGQNTCENLVKHSKGVTITAINRTPEKAKKLAEKYNIEFKSVAHLEKALEEADALVVSTNSTTPIITKENFIPKRDILILDLSIPNNVEDELKENKFITLQNVDDLSRRIDETLEQRKIEIPKAEAIISNMKTEFFEWEESRKYAPLIIDFKQNLYRLNQHNFKKLQKDNPKINGEETILAEKLAQKITNRFAEFILENPEKAGETADLMKQIFHLKAQ